MKNDQLKSRLLAEDIEENRFYAAISYLGFLFLIPLICRSRSAYVKYHLKQGIDLFLFEIIIFLCSYIPKAGWLFVGLLSFCCAFLLVLGAANALSGIKEPLPVIGKLSKSIK